ncbi:MAG: DUF5683 domain-containing protein [Candidatus Cloacimonetes bacterium]|nr:DUF5683 domain-containing protein [Candidatus Cloacimonadota bacterium]
MKKTCLISILMIMIFSLLAQEIDDFSQELVNSGRTKKSAHKAMLYSMIFPGAGQYYADKTSITTYIFPVIEIALLGGIIYYSAQGNKSTKDYEDYATKDIVVIKNSDGDVIYQGSRYNRQFQSDVEQVLMGVNQWDIYNPQYFRLDPTNTQHFYEDIGKYNKYIFGWTDWYHTFAADSDGDFMLSDSLGVYGNPYGNYPSVWVMSNTDPDFAHESVWLSNHTIDNYQQYLVSGDVTYLQNPVSPSSPSASPMRQKYIKMRQEAEDSYSAARTLSFGLVINHIASTLDALRLAKKWNRYVITQDNVKFHYYTSIRDDQLTPTLNLSYRF